MEPRSRVWNGNTLGSREARTYALVRSSPNPVTASAVRDALDIGSKGAKDQLRNLGKHRLIVRSPDDSGWVVGPVSPDEHDPARCPGCDSPALHTTGTPATRQRPSQPVSRTVVRHSAPVAELVPCPGCFEWTDPDAGCPGCGATPAVRSVPGPRRYLRDGTAVDTYPQTETVFTHPDGWSYIAVCDPATGAVHPQRVFKPGHPDYPHAVADAYRRSARTHDRHIPGRT